MINSYHCKQLVQIAHSCCFCREHSHSWQVKTSLSKLQPGRYTVKTSAGVLVATPASARCTNLASAEVPVATSASAHTLSKKTSSTMHAKHCRFHMLIPGKSRLQPGCQWQPQPPPDAPTWLQPFSTSTSTIIEFASKIEVSQDFNRGAGWQPQPPPSAACTLLSLMFIAYMC